MEADLQSVDRSITPWVIVGGHRPALIDSPYIVNKEYHTGDQEVSELMLKALEPLWARYKVSLGFWGHHHSYQRLCAYRNGQCVDKAVDMFTGIGTIPIPTYCNRSREGPVHIVVGTAGAGFSFFQNETPNFVE